MRKGQKVRILRTNQIATIVEVEKSGIISKEQAEIIVLENADMEAKDIPCGKYGTLDKYVPDGDYVVIKFARWAFEKFKGVEDKLGTQMRAVGEVMSIGKTYKEAFQKAIRSLETGRYGLGHANNFDTLTKEELLNSLVILLMVKMVMGHHMGHIFSFPL